MPKAIAVIPARAGSTRAKNKNFRVFNGTSLVEMAIIAAKDAGFFAHVILSTDSPLGIDLVKKHQIHLHSRSSFAASNEATATDVVRDIVDTVRDFKIYSEDYIFYLQPTSPRRDAQMLVHVWDYLKNSDEDGIVSVTAVDPKYAKLMKIRAGRLSSERKEQTVTTNQQDLEALYLANGNVFAFRRGVFEEKRTFPILGLPPLVQDWRVSLDIDSEQDLQSFFTDREC